LEVLSKGLEVAAITAYSGENVLDMYWLLFSIISSAVYAITNFVDKYLLEKQIKDYRGLVIFSTIVALFFGILSWIFAGFPILPLQDSVMVVLTGILTVWGLAFYFSTLASEETSTVIILMQLVPVITLIESSIFLHEKISTAQSFGFTLILSAIVGASFKKESLQVKPSKAFFFIILADILWASANVIFKFVTISTTFVQLVAYESFGIALGGLLLYIFSSTIRNAFYTTTKSLNKSAIGVIFINEIFFLIAKLLGYLAISLGPVSLVGLVGSTQVFFGIIYGWILTILLRKIYNEDISSDGLAKKILLFSLVFTGIWLMQY
jgi:drug/metabolite transporter (DMT)-like permease